MVVAIDSVVTAPLHDAFALTSVVTGVSTGALPTRVVGRVAARSSSVAVDVLIRAPVARVLTVVAMVAAVRARADAIAASASAAAGDQFARVGCQKMRDDQHKL